MWKRVEDAVAPDLRTRSLGWQDDPYCQELISLYGRRDDPEFFREEEKLVSREIKSTLFSVRMRMYLNYFNWIFKGYRLHIVCFIRDAVKRFRVGVFSSWDEWWNMRKEEQTPYSARARLDEIEILLSSDGCLTTERRKALMREKDHLQRVLARSSGKNN